MTRRSPLFPWMNGDLRQDSITKHLIFDCFMLVEHLSDGLTLEHRRAFGRRSVKAAAALARGSRVA